MTTLISIRSPGNNVRSCDSNCYGAKHEPCKCVCDGACHGVGVVEAINVVRRHSPDWIAAAGEGAEAELDDSLFQEPLFMIGDHPMPALAPLPSFSELVDEALDLTRKASDLLAAGYAQGTEPGWQRDEAKNEATCGIKQVVDALERACG